MKTKKTKAGRKPPVHSADRYRRQLTQVIAKMGDEELIRLCADAENPPFVSPGPPPGANLGASYQAALPFEIHQSKHATPFLHRSRPGYSDSGLESYMNVVDLSDHEGTIADQALSEGLRVSIKCSPEYAPDIAGAFAQRVPSRSVVFYDADGQRLVFRHENEEAIHMKQESDDK